MESWYSLVLEISALVGLILVLVTIPWVLTVKKESTSAVAWCLLVFFLPYFGLLFFLLFGYQRVDRHVRRRHRHRLAFRRANPTARDEARPGHPSHEGPTIAWARIARLARHFESFPLTEGNRIESYHDGQSAFAAITASVESARHHVHVQSFIVQSDAFGRQFVELLASKARAGVEVRLLYDAMGSYRLKRQMLEGLRAAGGRAETFLPLNPLRRRLQINLRNHRKILVVDGRVAFTGGLNIGREYLGQEARYGFWRDTHMRLEGPAVAGLQYVFLEDWDFAADEPLERGFYFPQLPAAGDTVLQIAQSGPDQVDNSIREIYFAAILGARRRLWIASPYFVPDAGLRDALALAGCLGVDVRLLCQYHPDKWIPYFAARYYWADMLRAGVKVYQYARGMMHSKLVLVDGEWASVGTANLDNRSLHLNFEVSCLIYSPRAVVDLEAAFTEDLRHSIRLNARVFAQRPFAGRLVENACRLLSPVL